MFIEWQREKKKKKKTNSFSFSSLSFVSFCNHHRRHHHHDHHHLSSSNSSRNFCVTFGRRRRRRMRWSGELACCRLAPSGAIQLKLGAIKAAAASETGAHPSIFGRILRHTITSSSGNTHTSVVASNNALANLYWPTPITVWLKMHKSRAIVTRKKE